MIYEISNPKVQLSKVTEVYALYQGVQHHDPDVELVLIDPDHVHPLEDRIALLKARSNAVTQLQGTLTRVKLKAIYVEIPNEQSKNPFESLTPEVPVVNVHLDKVPYLLKGGESAAIIDVTSQPDKGNDSE